MSIKALILLFCVYYSYEYDSYESYKISDENCGKPKTQKFIIDGSNATENEFPFMASLTIAGKLLNICGASLISRRYALTAAHCLINKEPQNYSLLMGENYRRNFRYNISLFGINQMIIPECWLQRGEIFNFDIGLIRLTADPIKENGNKIQTICLPPKNSEPIRNEDIFVAGWGKAGYTSDDNKDYPYFLQKAKMELRSEEYCHVYSSFRGLGVGDLTLTGDILCLKSETSSSCHGDSGGPAFQKFNGKWYQIGSASVGYETFPNIFADPVKKCYKSAPTIYTKISKYIDWINHSIEKYWNSTEKIVKTKC